MNFCVVILILKMKENRQHFCILCFIISRKVNTQLKCRKRFVQCVEKVLCHITDRTRQKWFAEFCPGDFSLDDAPQLCKPVEGDSNQIETLTENTQCYIT